MNLKTLLLFLLIVFALGTGHECMPPFQWKFIPVSSLKPAEFLLIRGNPMDSISAAVLRMDTANCFDFKSKSGPNGIGKLLKMPGFGLDKYRYRVRDARGRVDWDDLIELVELREDAKILTPAEDSLRRVPPTIGQSAGYAVVFLLGLTCTIVIVGLIFTGMTGAIFAGGK